MERVFLDELMFWTTVLHVAAYYGQLDVCRLLLDWGEGGYGGQVDRLRCMRRRSADICQW